MKASLGQIEKALDARPADIRLFLLHGPDESGSRALADRLARAMGPDAERIDLEGAALAKDPALLADEAASISLFGGARHIRVRATGEDATAAVTALLEADQAGNPVVVIAGALKPSSALLKLALASPAAMSFASYAPDGEAADRVAMAIARDAGIRIAPDVARRLADATGGDRALLAREIEKLALYVDAAPDRPGEIDHDTLDLLGADSGEGELSRLVDAVLSGSPDHAVRELERLAMDGVDGMPLVRALLRRLLLLIPLRAQVDAGESIDAVMASAGKALFWKEKASVGRQLRTWNSERLATAHTRLLQAERDLKSPAAAGPVLVSAELIAVSRAAARRR
jgi:DNA polymerase-3 subunit delta